MLARARDELIELSPPCLGDAEKKALCAVIDSGWLAMGDRVSRFERSFARLHFADEAVAVNSATAALQLCLAAFELGPGDEVLVPSLTFVATAAVVIQAGATPVFVDIESLSRPLISLEDAARKITPRTRAVIVVHYAGYVADLKAWREFANRYGLFLFEDAAHATGVAGEIGIISDAAAFSFFSNKNMTTAEGGMLLVPDPPRRERIRRMRAHGMTASTLDRTRGSAISYDVTDCGFNFRMDELRAAVGLVQLERLPAWNEKRRELTRYYRQTLAASLPLVRVPFAIGHQTSAHIMTLLLPEGCDRARIIHTFAPLPSKRLSTIRLFTGSLTIASAFPECRYRQRKRIARGN